MNSKYSHSWKKGRSDFSHRKGRVCKIAGELFVKGEYHCIGGIFYSTIVEKKKKKKKKVISKPFTPRKDLSLLFPRKDLVLLSRISRCVTSASNKGGIFIERC